MVFENHIIFAVPNARREVLLKSLIAKLAKCESSSAGRARPCQGRGRGFESRLPLKNPSYEGFLFRFALVVELVDTRDLKSRDHCGRAGSSPAWGTLIMRSLAKVNDLFFVLGFLSLHTICTQSMEITVAV